MEWRRHWAGRGSVWGRSGVEGGFSRERALGEGRSLCGVGIRRVLNKDLNCNSKFILFKCNY